MNIIITTKLIEEIHAHGEQAYPDEGVGLLLGYDQNGNRVVQSLLKLTNAREESARHNRYLITAEDILQGEQEAEKQGLSIIGIFHSHPDHPNQPSEFDREWAIPWYSYLITSVHLGQAVGSKSWRLKDDRSSFILEELILASEDNS